MALSDLITEDVVRVPLEADRRDAAIAELLDLLVANGRVVDRSAALAALMERESQGSTGLTHGIAVPHAKTDAVSTLSLAIGVSPPGVDFLAPNGELSHLVFLMLGPPELAAPHIEALSEIARLSRAPAFLRALSRADRARDVVDLFNE